MMELQAKQDTVSEINDSGSILSQFEEIEYVDPPPEEEDAPPEEGAIEENPEVDNNSEVKDEVTETPDRDPRAESTDAPLGTIPTDDDLKDETNDLRELIEDFKGDAFDDLLDKKEQDLEDSIKAQDEQLTQDYKTNHQLTQLNEHLTDKSNSLNRQLEYTEEDLQELILKDTKDINQLKRTLYDMEAYNNYLVEEDQAKRAEDEEVDDDDDKDDYILMGHTTMVYVISVGFLFLILLGARNVLGIHIDDIFEPAMYSLFTNITILALLSVITAIFWYFDVFDGTDFDMCLLLIGTALFVLIWFLCALWLIVAGQAISRNWSDKEVKCTDLEALEQEYKDLYASFHNGEVKAKVLQKEYTYIEYAVMRQEFICPTYLAPVCESFLRNDFDFGEYLSRCVADTLANFYNFSWFSYVIVVIGMAIWRGMVYAGEIAMYITFFVFPLILIITLLVVILKLRGIYYGLVPFTGDPDELHLPTDQFTLDPLYNIEHIKQPPYLTGKIFPKDHEKGLIKVCWKYYHPFELSYAYIFEGRYPNRHEVLFWFDSSGVKFVMSIIQAIAVLLVLWTVVIILFYVGFFHESVDLWAIVIIGLSFMLVLFMLCYQIPEAIRLLSIVSKIGMMKDRNLLYATVQAAKERRAENNLRIYRQVKLFRREIVKQKYPGEEHRAKADRHIEKLASEAYQLYIDGEQNHISLDRLEDVLHQCGQTLKEDEMRVFANECADKKTKRIYITEFLEAVESFQHDVAIPPQTVMALVLKDFFSDKYPGLEIQSVGLNELTRFFDVHHRHLLQRDVIDFLHEVKYLTNKDKEISIDEVASLIRDDVEIFAR